jgi:hypothetical protein
MCVLFPYIVYVVCIHRLKDYINEYLTNRLFVQPLFFLCMIDLYAVHACIWCECTYDLSGHVNLRMSLQ